MSKRVVTLLIVLVITALALAACVDAARSSNGKAFRSDRVEERELGEI